MCFAPSCIWKINLGRFLSFSHYAQGLVYYLASSFYVVFLILFLVIVSSWCSVRQGVEKITVICMAYAFAFPLCFHSVVLRFP